MVVDGSGGASPVRLLSVNLSVKPRWVQLLVCGGLTVGGFMVNGIIEEYIYNHLRFSYGWWFSLLQGLCFMLLVLISGFRPSQKVNPWRAYVNLSFFLAVGMGLTRCSLAYLNYPAQIVFKSSKVIPVMLMGPFFPKLRRRYSVLDYTSAVMLVVGLILFILADASITPHFRMTGVVLIGFALICDAFIGNQQEQLFTLVHTTQEEMLFCSTLVGVPIIMVPLILTGELSTAWNSCWTKPHVYLLMILSSLISYIAQMAVLSLVALFGAATTYMVTTTRKAFTVLLSYIIFSKPFTEQHTTGLLLICMALTLKAMPNPFAPNPKPPPVKEPVSTHADEFGSYSNESPDDTNRDQDVESRPQLGDNIYMGRLKNMGT